MGAPTVGYPFRHGQPQGKLRLKLAPSFERDAINGLWRPYSRDLTSEAPHLIDDFPSARGRVDRLVYSPGDWETVASQVFTKYGRIRVGFFPPQTSTGLVLLRLVGSEIVLLRTVWT